MTRDEAHAMMVEAAARSDAEFDKRGWLEMPKHERERYLARARKSLTAANAAAWRPIESAPRDGTEVIVTDGLGVYGEAWWHDGDQVWLGCDGCEPTHWMPLPAPPATPEASE